MKNELKDNIKIKYNEKYTIKLHDNGYSIMTKQRRISIKKYTTDMWGYYLDYVTWITE